MSEVIYTESCHAGLLCMALNLGNSFGSSLSVGVYRIKLNNLTKYVELPVECLRTRVQFPPPPPKIDAQRFSVGHFLCGIPQTRGGSCGNLRTLPVDHPTCFRPLSALSTPIVSVLFARRKGSKSAKEIRGPS